MPKEISRAAQVRALKLGVLGLKVSAKLSGQKIQSEMVQQIKLQIDFLKLSDLFDILDDKWGRDGFTDPAPYERFRGEVLRMGRKVEGLQRSLG